LSRPLDFRLLGPLEVRDGDRPLALGGRKQRTRLAILLLHTNEVVSSDTLIDGLWGEHAPKYVEGEMRSLPWSERFDRVLSWFSSFGYFGDDGNRQVLREAHKALKPGGLLAVETAHRDWLLPVYADEEVTEREGDQMVDRYRFDVQTGRSHGERTYIRGGVRRTIEFSVRLLSASELRGWMLDAGFREAFAYGADGEPLTLESRRMTVVGHK
jgi:SAM-dependent methyltransferase